MADENDFAAGWRPEQKGDKAAGRVVDITVGQGGYDPYPIVTVENDAGEQTAIHAFHTVLRGELAKRRPQVGDEISVTYLGKRDVKGGRGDYHAYRVTGGQAQPYNWDQDLPDGMARVDPQVSDIPNDLPPPVPATRQQPVTVPDDDGSPLPF